MYNYIISSLLENYLGDYICKSWHRLYKNFLFLYSYMQFTSFYIIYTVIDHTEDNGSPISPMGTCITPVHDFSFKTEVVIITKTVSESPNPMVRTVQTTITTTSTTTVQASVITTVTTQLSCSCSDQQKTRASSSSDSDAVAIFVPIVVVFGVIIIILLFVIGILIWRKPKSRSETLTCGKVVTNTTTIAENECTNGLVCYVS